MLTLLCAAILCGGSIGAADPPARGKVSLSLAGDGIQPDGWPVVVQVTVTNVGPKPLFWSTIGPGSYLQAEEFVVQVRYGSDTDWHDIPATNGQYIQGGLPTDHLIEPGKSITVPLAVPIAKPGTVRIRTRTWETAQPAEEFFQTSDNHNHAESHRHRVILAAMQQSPAFWFHIAQAYPDRIVLDAMLKLAAIDNEKIVSGAATVLRRQRVLPEPYGAELLAMVQRWLSRIPERHHGPSAGDLVDAALKTRSEVVRKEILNMLRKPPNKESRLLIIESLTFSPGDKDWLKLVRASVIEVQKDSPEDPELANQITRTTKWLDSRIKHGDD